ncbi:hypothetical protein [Streptomyces sp. NPDC046727]|uniref:pyroglutamyl-peptidase I family protein n=1 Tax=Streptomyces sp. NPDC046727 TaxID=3155373 RepID=UPI0033E7C81C
MQVRESLKVLRKPVLETDPDLVMSLGLSPRAGISIERVAINVNDCPAADNAGRTAKGEPIVADGPTACFSTLPSKRCVAEVPSGRVTDDLGAARVNGGRPLGVAATVPASPQVTSFLRLRCLVGRVGLEPTADGL